MVVSPNEYLSMKLNWRDRRRLKRLEREIDKELLEGINYSEDGIRVYIIGAVDKHIAYRLEDKYNSAGWMLNINPIPLNTATRSREQYSRSRSDRWLHGAQAI